ncbi:MAG: ion transporter [Lachnospiraceae bacterium]|nr:ion transporter [Lachnospiraceae bacterium]
MCKKTESKKWGKRIFDIIQIGQREDMISRFFDYFIVAVIFINIVAMFLETFDEMNPYFNIIRGIEMATMIIFMLEYILRVATAQYLFPEKDKRSAVLSYILSADGIIMLLTILPFFYLSGFVVFRMLRVVRIFHLFRINNTYDSFHVITQVIYEKRNQIISSVFIVVILMMASSLCMYSAEHNAQPTVFKNALSGFWWSMSTIFTVGYGDIYPVTVLGKMMTFVITLLGVGVIAIPTGIISAGFVEQYTQMQKQDSLSAGGRRTVSANVDDKSPFKGMRVKEVEEKYSITVSVIVRKESVLLPSDSIVFENEDIVVYQEN